MDHFSSVVDSFYNAVRSFYNIVSELRRDVLADASQLIEEHCQLQAGNGYLAVTYRRPDGTVANSRW